MNDNNDIITEWIEEDVFMMNMSFLQEEASLMFNKSYC